MKRKLVLALAFSLTINQAFSNDFSNISNKEKYAQQATVPLKEDENIIDQLPDEEQLSHHLNIAQLSDNDKAVTRYCIDLIEGALHSKKKTLSEAIMSSIAAINSYVEDAKAVYSLIIYAFYDSLLEGKGDMKNTNNLFEGKLDAIKTSIQVYFTR